MDTESSQTGSSLLIRAYNFKEVETGNLKAFCSVDIGAKIKLHSCRVVQQRGQLPWASLPQSEWTDSEGQRRFYPVVELPRHVEHQVKKAVLRGWEEFEHGHA